MATNYKILGQANPGSTPTLLYTAPAATQAIASTITATNTGTAANTYSIAVRVNADNLTSTPAATTPVTKEYIAYSVTINPGDTISYTLGLALSAWDQIIVLNTTAGGSTFVAFNAFGIELS